MSRFKIGQRVVALKNQSEGTFKRGDILTIDGFSCCLKCGKKCVYLVEHAGIFNMLCDGSEGCGNIAEAVRERYNERIFAPLTSLSDAIEYRLKVSEPELDALKLKEVSLQ